MNHRQKRALWIGILVAVLMGLVPPWVHWAEEGQRSHLGTISGPGAYGFILDPPPAPNEAWSTGIDYGRLAVQSVLILLVTGGAVRTLGSEEEDQARSDSGSPPAES